MKVNVLYRSGGRGHTVCVIRRSDSGLYLRWWDGSLRGGKGDYVWQSLEHNDQTRGEDECIEAMRLLKASHRIGGYLTVAGLFALYEKHRIVKKTAGWAARERHRMELWQRFLVPSRDVLTLDTDVVSDYADWRREQGVGDTTIGHEIVF